MVSHEENRVLVQVLRMALTAQECNEPGTEGSPIVYLEALAQELRSEGSDTALNHGMIDRALMSRLADAPVKSYPQPPFQYLLGCFQRVENTMRSTYCGATSATNADHMRQALSSTLKQVANFIWLTIKVPDIIWQPDVLRSRGVLQIYDSLLATQHPTPLYPGASEQCIPLPPGLLELLVDTYDEEFSTVLQPMMRSLSNKSSSTSILGDFISIINYWSYLLTSKSLALAVVQDPSFCPSDSMSTRNGRMFQVQSALASLIGITYLPDDGALMEPLPSVRSQCFMDIDITHPSAALISTMESLRQGNKALVSGICSIISAKGILGKETRPHTMRFLASLLHCNAERAKMQVDYLKASSDGLMYNMCRVLLKLCDPFMDPSLGKVYQFVTTKYLANIGYMHLNDDETRFAADTAEFVEWKKAIQAAGPASPPHFVCECFYMTALAMHLGYAKIVDQLQSNDMRMYQRLRSMFTPNDTSPQGRRVASEFERYKARIMASTAALLDPDMTNMCLRWCKLVASWLLHAATGTTSPSSVQLPLPSTPPTEFKMIPEFLIEDVCCILKYLSTQHVPITVQLEEVVLCCTALMSAPAYVSNPYLRYRMVEVLYFWMPDTERGRNNLQRRATSSMEYLFTCHSAVVAQLVPGLLLLYQDIEYTERANQFYEKFSMRAQIADLLAWLWEVPQHRDAWITFANVDQGRGTYMRFLNYVVTDSTYLLDEAMKNLPEVKSMEALQDDPVRWNQMNPQEQAEHKKELDDLSGRLKFYLQTAGGFINMLIFTSAQVAAPMLRPEMVEPVATMLNYFLKHLTGSERAKLKVKNPEKLGFSPKELLANILNVYLNLGASDREGIFVRAISEDGRSYRPENFIEAIRLASGVGLPGFTMEHITRLNHLSTRVSTAFEQMKTEETEMMDIPDEFLDPVLMSLMKDPVKLPTSENVMERGSILRILLSDPRDPFNRKPLQPEDLIPDTELKARIEAWLASQRSGTQ